MLTYGDGVANIDIAKLLEFHKSHDKLATITVDFRCVESSIDLFLSEYASILTDRPCVESFMDLHASLLMLTIPFTDHPCGESFINRLSSLSSSIFTDFPCDESTALLGSLASLLVDCRCVEASTDLFSSL
jgi:hypothetical protein